MNFFQDIKQKIEKGVEQVGKSSQRVIEINRLNLKLNGKRQEFDLLMNRIGWSFFQQWRQNTPIQINSELEYQFRMASGAWEEIQSIEKEIQILKNGSNIDEVNHSLNIPIQPKNSFESNSTSMPLEGDKESTVKTVISVPKGEYSIPPIKQVSAGHTYNQSVAPISMAVVYICPFCAHQVPNHSNQCSTCGQKYY